MTTKLETLKDEARTPQRRKRVGRGPGSGMGKTSGRGHKGMGARSGCKRRRGYIGGGTPLHRALPTRGFSNVNFQRRFDVINLELIERIYSDGEIVSLETLRQKGYTKGRSHGVKVLGEGELTKKVTFQVEALSKSAREKIIAAGIEL